MIVNRKHFPEITQDNDEMYIAHLQGVIDSIDEYAKMEITKSLSGYHFRIVPSLPKYNMPLLEEILKLNNLYHLRLSLSKSIKTSGTLSFDIPIK